MGKFDMPFGATVEYEGETWMVEEVEIIKFHSARLIDVSGGQMLANGKFLIRLLRGDGRVQLNGFYTETYRGE